MQKEELIQIISLATKHEPNLIFKSTNEIKKAVTKGWIIILEPNILDVQAKSAKLKGFVIVTPLTKNLVEVGSLYVLPEYRRQGNGKLLIQKALIACGNRHILIRTKEKGLKAMLEKKGFTRVSLKKSWQLGLIYLWSRLSHPKKWLYLIKTFKSKSTAMIFKPDKVNLY